jgi:thiamine-monophosphate kinase
MPLPEKALIAQVRRLVKEQFAGQRGAGRTGASRRASRGEVLQGIGDDCAVLRTPAALDLLVTTDFSLEGVHFRRDWHSPESVGHRCLTRGLSDIAAMGGTPVAAFLSLAVSMNVHQHWVTGFVRGLLKLANQYHVTLAGGDTAESPNRILADIIVLGSVPKGRAILRSGARPGDRVFVSGDLGGSAAAIGQLRSGHSKAVELPGFLRHFWPQPRIDLGRILQERKLASAMIDTSDGLSSDLAHICEESRVGAEINSASIPRARVGSPTRQVDLESALHGGEDYELLFTVPARKKLPAKLAGVALTEIGRITKSRGIVLRDAKGRRRKLEPSGWEHFRA